MKHLAIIIAAGSLAAISTPAMAADIVAPIAPSHTISFDAGTAGFSDRDDDRRDRRYRRGRGHDDRVYDRRGQYREPRRLDRRDRVWRERDGRYRCERDNGTTGLVIGAGVGALLGRTIDTRGDRTVGTLLGAVAGGLLGREVDRSELRCR